MMKLNAKEKREHFKKLQTLRERVEFLKSLHPRGSRLGIASVTKEFPQFASSETFDQACAELSDTLVSWMRKSNFWHSGLEDMSLCDETSEVRDICLDASSEVRDICLDASSEPEDETIRARHLSLLQQETDEEMSSDEDMLD